MSRFFTDSDYYVICDRTGAKIPRTKAIREPGTGYFIDRRWSDGNYNEKDHPLNFAPKARPEAKRVKHSRNGSQEGALNYLLTEDGDPIITEDGNLILIE